MSDREKRNRRGNERDLQLQEMITLKVENKGGSRRDLEMTL